MRFKLKATTFWWVVIAIMIIGIILLCRACFASFKKADSAKTEEVTTTTTTIATAETEVKQEEDIEETAKEEAVEETATTAEDNNEKTVEEEQVTVEEKKVEEDTSAEAESVKQYGIDDPDATALVAYLGERPVNMQEIPTFGSYVTSQEKAWMIDFKGTSGTSNNDPRRLYFKVPIEAVTMEYESNGVTKTKELKVEELDSQLYRVTPPYSTRIKMIK